ncbi:MAG: hypothetical protein K0S40_4767 [Actinomycetospora sp.]|nr:hypothetical protein [Actinomycetospora sp.]
MGSLPMLGWLWPTLILIGLALIAVATVALARRAPWRVAGARR